MLRTDEGAMPEWRCNSQPGDGAIREIGQAIEELSQIAIAIAAPVDQQVSATQEISRKVPQAARGTTK